MERLALVVLEALTASCTSHGLPRNSAFTVGRSSSVDVRLACPQVSRVHARFWTDSESLFVEVCSAWKGVTVNGSRFGSETGDGVLLRHEDVVEIYDASWTVFYYPADDVARDVHRLYELDFEVMRAPRKRGSRRRNVFARVVAAERRAHPSRVRSSSTRSFEPVDRHQSAVRMNVRTRNIYKEQAPHLEKGDEASRAVVVDTRTFLTVSPVDFGPLSCSSPITNEDSSEEEEGVKRVLAPKEETRRRSHFREDFEPEFDASDIVVESVAYV